MREKTFKLTYKQIKELLLAEQTLDALDHPAILNIDPTLIYPKIEMEKYTIISRPIRGGNIEPGPGVRMTYIITTTDVSTNHWLRYIINHH